ncbi:VWA domain-containing protein [Bifidobacterium amazonense]|uniref:VWA domain-containing protein n=1 Tax=Bifidobacterium amazonense TaxID=2809027 RepID=A0ABS9VTQ9_9BIFI|nr:VWA domain-containing protein [Bifidobacterium amazonense]MCH9275329.1 VWA domain-containing protein [Bifidobacterium amazonense]
MMLSWQWPWAAAAGALCVMAVILLVAVLGDPRRGGRGGKGMRGQGGSGDALPVFSLDDDLNTEHASRLFHQWRVLGRLTAALLAAALALCVALLARPSLIDRGEELSSSRDIVLCLDVSGSTLPYDREVLETYLSLVSNFQGERIGLSIFNSTSRTVFPLTDDYDLVARELKSAAETLKGVESQADIDKMSDRQYQRISDWLDGTQNRTNATSLIGDGVVSCAAMLPGFAYGSGGSNGSDDSASGERRRAASIVLATDNVVSGKPTYSLSAALDLVHGAGITVDGLFSGPKASESESTTTDMKKLIESHDGIFLTQSNGASVNELVRSIDQRRTAHSERSSKASVTDAPGWWTLALAVAVAAWLAVAWRLRR